MATRNSNSNGSNKNFGKIVTKNKSDIHFLKVNGPAQLEAAKLNTYKDITADYTILESDMGMKIRTTNVITITFPYTLPIGFWCRIWNDDGSVVTLDGDAHALHAIGTSLETQYTSVTAEYAAANQWELEGALT